MNILDSIILGVIEGLTEFLPISSTGHLILASSVLGIQKSVFLNSFEIIIQLGAILAVVFMYWNKLLSNKQLALKVITAFMPTAIIGFMLYSFIKKFLLNNDLVVIISLIVGGLILIAFEKIKPAKNDEVDDAMIEKSSVENITYAQSFKIGLFQSIAMIPGVSRSGATIIGGEALGLSRRSIVEFSFLLAIPTMLSATALDILKGGLNINADQWLILATGFLTSFIVALLAIKSFLSYIQKHSFVAFGVYRIIIAIIFWGIIYL